MDLVKTLARLRRAYPALRHGDFNLLWHGGDAFAFLRRFEGQRALEVISGKAVSAGRIAGGACGHSF
jgi:hypothetical protein